MKNLWQKFLADEAGVVLSSEMALVGTVGVLGMVVGLESVTCAVTSELNDLAGAFGAINQTYNYNSLNKARHARVSGSGYVDRADFCDCQLISQTDVVGTSGLGNVQGGGFSQSLAGPSVVMNSAPVVQEEIVQERIVDEVPLVTETVKAVECPDDEIIEERIILRRVKSDCDCSKTTTVVPKSTTVVPKAKVSKPAPTPMSEEKIETKPRKKG